MVKRKRGNVYANLTLMVFHDVTLIYAKILSLHNVFFCEVTRVSEKVIEIINNSELNNNSEFILHFRFNLQFSVRVQMYTMF